LIHATAIIDNRADIDSSVEIGPYAIIDGEVSIGAGTRVDGHATIKGPTRIGADNHIYQFASIGDDPQDKKYKGEATSLEIGDRNTIREFCTINRGTVQDQGSTRIGDDNWIMAYAHIAHDCVVGNGTIFANNASIAGHVHVGDFAILGGFTAVHQFCQIGMLALTSMFTYVTKDVPAFVVASGRPAEPRGINAEGIKRRGYSATALRNIREAYKVVYRQGLRLEEAMLELERRVSSQAELQPLLDSLRRGDRGLIR
jgi:UDP-N-acetylglucosamine acyltransferase